MISSSAVYPEYEKQPFTEETPVGENKFWGSYGTGKIEAERALQERDPKAYILRPPYLYGPLNNVYREAFVFDCAMAKRPFFLPGDGEMKLQFFHVNDLCRFMDILMEKTPGQVEKQTALMPCTKMLAEGLKESFEWYRENRDCVKKKPFLEYIDNYLIKNLR